PRRGWRVAEASQRQDGMGQRLGAEIPAKNLGAKRPNLGGSRDGVTESTPRGAACTDRRRRERREPVAENDHEVIERFRMGDWEAGKSLLDRYAPRLLSQARS